MNESVRPRFAIDLNEIEKQVGQQAQPPAAPARNDPLAELARIVGQDDPFQSLLAGDRSRRPATPAEPSFDDLFATRDGAARNGAPTQQTPRLRSSFEPDDQQAHDPYGQLGASYADYQAKVEAEGDYDPHFAPGYEDGAYHQDVSGAGYTAQPSRRKSRKLLIAAGAAGGLVVLGLGGVLMLNSPATMVAGGEPPLIKATNEPSKVQPQSPGGLEIPNQNKQIYERADRDTQTRVVNREEQPVDVRQAARAMAPSDASGGARPQASGTPAANNGLNLGEPRRVRTVSIRPDGTIISPEAPPSAPQSAPAAAPAPRAMSLPPATQPATSPAAQVMPVPTTPAPRGVAATPAAPAAGGSSPQQSAAATPAPPGPQRVATAQPITIAPAQTPAVPTPATAPATSVASISDAAGGWAVQLGVSGSEPEARTTLQRLQQKFPDLDGATPLIRKAEVNGNTIYRIRVGPMSREDASSLCSRIQGQGGQCFAARN
jgi:hypothetical protein